MKKLPLPCYNLAVLNHIRMMFVFFFMEGCILMARAQTWSQIISSSNRNFPRARVSDRHLTEHCGILDHLLPGDLVLADRGFNVHEAADLYCAEVNRFNFNN